MFKIIQIIFSYFIETLTSNTNSNHIYEKIIDNIFERINLSLTTIAYSFTGLCLFITGFSVAYFNLLFQYDRIGSVNIGAVSTGGVVLCFLGVGIIANSKRKSTTKTLKKQISDSPHAPIFSPIEQALAALLMDFIKEREHSRNEEKNISHPETTEHIFSQEVNIH